MRRTRTLLIPLLVAGLAAGTALTSSPQDDEPTPLQEAMGGLQKGQRAMRRMVKDPVANEDALLGTISQMQGHALRAFSLPPDPPDGEDARAWRIGFQRSQLQVLDALLETELAVHGGDAQAAQAGYARLGEIKKAGHDKYQPDQW